jgi:hypothetical protein
LRCNTVAIEKPLPDRRPEPAAHQWIDFRQTLALKNHRLARPLARAVAKDATGDLSLVGIEGWIW